MENGHAYLCYLMVVFIVGQITVISRDPFSQFQLKLEEDAHMSTDNVRSEDNSCKEKCDDDFISCVEHSRANCLDEFNTCSSACSR